MVNMASTPHQANIIIHNHMSRFLKVFQFSGARQFNFILIFLLYSAISGAQPYLHYLMAGEAAPTSIMLQTRLAIQANITYTNAHDKEALM